MSGFLVAAFILALTGTVRAKVQVPQGNDALDAWAAGARTVKPTVTKEMGDQGGKFFGKVPDGPHVRHYYIAADLDAWDYAPQRRDVVCGKPLPPQINDHRTAMKVRYFQYTDDTFTTKLIPTPRLGLLGPVLRGVVGDTLVVTFFNKTDYPLSMHPHGVKYDKDSEGALYDPNPGLGAAVGPGAKFTYVWQLDESSGPLPTEPSSKAWLYHSHVHGDEEANLGLIGFIIVTDPKRARPDGTPNDVDREMASLFMIFNESGLSEEELEAQESAPGAPDPGSDPAAQKTWADIQETRELGSRYAINGYIFGNQPGLEMNEGERVRWYLFGLGDENDQHTAHWHGLRVTEEGRRRTDVVELQPASMKVADLVADNPGTWLFHCHVAEHMNEGMFAPMTVHPKANQRASRVPEDAFFGLPASEQSLRISRAEARLIAPKQKSQSVELRFWGSATVHSAFSVFAEPVTFQIGSKSVTFTPARDGNAAADGNTYRVINSGRYGVVYGELMEFEANLAGAEWAAELKSVHALDARFPASEFSVPIEMRIGSMTHRAKVSFRVTDQK